MTLIPPDVTNSGDLEVHNRGRHQFTFSFTDDLGVVRNVAARNFWFETERGQRFLLINGGATHQKVLTVLPYQLEELLDQTVEAAILDETTLQHTLEWQGVVSVSGWPQI